MSQSVREIEAVGVYRRKDGDINMWFMGPRDMDSPTYRLSPKQALDLLKQLVDLEYYYQRTIDYGNDQLDEARDLQALDNLRRLY